MSGMSLQRELGFVPPAISLYKQASIMGRCRSCWFIQLKKKPSKDPTPQKFNELMPKMAILQAGVTFFSMPVILGYPAVSFPGGIYLNPPKSALANDVKVLN